MANQYKLPIPTESTEQIHLFRWAVLEYGKWPELELMYHVPNEGKRSYQTGQRMRMEGLKSGVPDICLPVPRGKYHGLYMELKRLKGGAASENQKAWMEALEQQGYFVALCRGWEKAAETITNYLKLSKEERK